MCAYRRWGSSALDMPGPRQHLPTRCHSAAPITHCRSRRRGEGGRAEADKQTGVHGRGGAVMDGWRRGGGMCAAPARQPVALLSAARVAPNPDRGRSGDAGARLEGVGLCILRRLHGRALLPVRLHLQTNRLLRLRPRPRIPPPSGRRDGRLCMYVRVSDAWCGCGAGCVRREGDATDLGGV